MYCIFTQYLLVAQGNQIISAHVDSHDVPSHNYLHTVCIRKQKAHD